MKTRRHAAFTLVEILVAACLSSLVGLIIYGVASEALADFARNVSINRSYSNARQTLDRISMAMQSAGHTPLLLTAAGLDTTAGPAAGIRFWRYGSQPLYYINTPLLTDSSLTLSLTNPNSGPAILSPPAVGDLITVAVLGFQARAVSVTTSGTTATVNFAGTVVSNTGASGAPQLTPASLASAATSAALSSGGKMSCLDWTSVAFIAINNQLRYFPKFISGTTNVSTPANYQILTYLTATAGTQNTAAPFSLGPTPSVNVDLYAEAPDYNNRTTIAGTQNGSVGLSTANTYTFLQTALAPRCATIVQNPP